MDPAARLLRWVPLVRHAPSEPNESFSVRSIRLLFVDTVVGVPKMLRPSYLSNVPKKRDEHISEGAFGKGYLEENNAKLVIVREMVPT